jgi:hypothetical protein
LAWPVTLTLVVAAIPLERDGGILFNLNWCRCDGRSPLPTFPAAFGPDLATVLLWASVAITARAAFATRALGDLNIGLHLEGRGLFGRRHLATLARLFLRECGGKGSRCQQCSKGECLFHDHHSVGRACTIVAASHAPLFLASR